MATGSNSSASRGDLGRRVTQRRTDLGLSRDELAKRAAMALAYVEWVEEGSAQVSVAALGKLADALETSPWALLGGGAELAPGRGGARPGRDLRRLDPDECRRLLGDRGIGRVVFIVGDRPVAVPVNYVLVDDGVVFRTAPDTDTAAATGTRVGFEVDRIDDAMSEGWSVLISGQLEPVEDEATVALAVEAKLEPWAGGDRPLYLRIVPSEVTGRQLTSRGGK